MKQYFSNLMIALFGRNPYRVELDDVREKYTKTEENVKALRDLYCKCQERMDEDKKIIYALQSLTEKLRQHLDEKDVLIERLKSDYQKRLSAYNAEIDALRQK